MKKFSFMDWIVKGASYLFDFRAELFGYDVQDLLGTDWAKRDQEALAKDWQAVGDHLRSAMAKIDKEINDGKKLP